MKKLGFNIVLLGMVASGKDTQAQYLMQDYALKPIESGKFWRKMEKSKTPDGDLIRKTTSLGKPAPVKLMKEFLTLALEKIPKNKSLLFLGNPRLKPEAQLLTKMLKEKKEKLLVLYISLPKKEVYHRSNLRMRNADDKKYIDRRIAWHTDQVGKTVKYFEGLGVMKKINGNQPITKVNQDILKEIEKYKKLLESKN